MTFSKSITIFTDSFWPSSAGVGNATLSFARALHEAGWAVEVITPKRIATLPTKEGYQGINIFRPHLGWWMTKPVFKWIYYFLFLVFVLKRLGQTKPSYLLGQDAWAGGLAAVIGAKFFKSTAIVHTHAHPPYANRLLFLAKLAYRHCDIILSTTEDYLKFLKKDWLIDKLGYVLPNTLYPLSINSNSVNQDDLKKMLDWAVDKFHIINIGRMALEKGVETKGINFIIEAMGHLPDCVLHLVGDGPLRVKYEKQAEGLDLKNQIQFNGFVNQDKLVKMMTAADVLVMTSLHEGLSMAVLEALNLRLPIITTATSGAMSYLVDGQSAIFIEIGNSLAIVQAVEKLRQTVDLRKKIIDNGYNVYQEQFHPDKAIKRFETILKAYENSSLQTK